jgi:hypothetical protein
MSIKMSLNLDSIKAAMDTAKVAALDKIVSDLQAATPVKTGFARSRWQHNGVSITNDAPYITELNAGHSQQAPAFFIEQTVLNEPGVSPSGTIVRSQ